MPSPFPCSLVIRKCSWKKTQIEKKTEKINSGHDGHEQNDDPTEDPTVKESDLPDITYAERSVLEFQEETCEEDLPSKEW